jgi:YHS domain-containing protein
MRYAFIFGALILSSSLIGQELQSYSKTHYNLKDDLAIQGYDPVAYFTENKAKEGSRSISTTYKGITYRFSSEKNKQIFLADSKKYEPEYGGYCAYAMASGDKVKIDPETFKIQDGRLLLFYNFRFTNTLTKWDKDESTFLMDADTEWLKIIKN